MVNNSGVAFSLLFSISNNHECEGEIEKTVPRITVWHYEACRVMTNVNPERWIFLSHPHKNDGFLFLLNIKYRICILKRGYQKFLR